jgi:hypothetical protein
VHNRNNLDRTENLSLQFNPSRYHLTSVNFDELFQHTKLMVATSEFYNIPHNKTSWDLAIGTKNTFAQLLLFSTQAPASPVQSWMLGSFRTLVEILFFLDRIPTTSRVPKLFSNTRSCLIYIFFLSSTLVLARNFRIERIRAFDLTCPYFDDLYYIDLLVVAMPPIFSSVPPNGMTRPRSAGRIVRAVVFWYTILCSVVTRLFNAAK